MVLNTIIIMLPQDDNAKSHGNLPLIHETPIMINVNTGDDLTKNCTENSFQAFSWAVAPGFKSQYILYLLRAIPSFQKPL